jgi:hypothetical protein
MKNNPGLTISAAGNKIFIGFLKQQAQQKIDLAQIAESSASPAEFFQKRDAYLQANPLRNPWTGAAFGSGKAAAANPVFAGAPAAPRAQIKVPPGASPDQIKKLGKSGDQLVFPDGEIGEIP